MRVVLRTVAVGMIALAGGAVGWGQSETDGNDEAARAVEEGLELPRPIVLVAEDQMPEGMYLAPLFYPVGWSGDGAFAFVTCRHVAGRGGTRTHYTVLDAVTDGVLFEEEVDLVEAGHRCPGSDRGPAVGDTRSSAWNAAHEPAQRRFAGALRDHGIQRRPGRPKLHRFPLTRRGATYRAEVSTVREEREDRKFWDDLESYTVSVAASGRGRKEIAAADQVEGFSMWVIGALLSPFEPRMIVVVGHEVRGFEGTEARYILSGAHLEAGYN
jgi:hypothetical protein